MYGATIASVGQASIQRVHVPQKSLIGPSSSNSRSNINSAIKKKDPFLG
jgi:hypothetical protein